jgi:hypothetical protein
MRFQKHWRQWRAIAGRGHVALDLINGKELHPFVVLGLIRDNLRVERLRDAADADAPARIDDKFLFQPQLLLEILELRKEVDDLARDIADDLNLEMYCSTLARFRSLHHPSA